MHILESKHPIWLVGFRPFFVLAICLAAIFPILWWAIFTGQISLPNSLNPIQWHAHEMLFGFGGAILIGFLLTASKNWVGIRGILGKPLMILVGLWIFERLVIYFISDMASVFGHFLLSLFFVAAATYLVQTMYVNRKNDSFKDNFYFYILLGSALLAKNLLISREFYNYGVTMSVGIFRLAFAVMFERTMTQFMKSTEGVQVFRNQYLDYSIKTLVALAVFQNFLPEVFSTSVLFLAGSLLLVRWLLWSPLRGLRKFGNATMYLGYFGLIVHFFLEAAKQGGYLIGVGSISLHTFTFVTMGLVIPSMIVRISQGHTGRKPEFTKIDCAAIAAIMIAGIFRLVLVSLYPEQIHHWLLCASVLWFVAYVILGFRFIPMLIHERIDGKAH